MKSVNKLMFNKLNLRWLPSVLKDSFNLPNLIQRYAVESEMPNKWHTSPILIKLMLFSLNISI